jgi:hypothetical protein
MAPLSQTTVAELLEDYAALRSERAEIAAVLEQLLESFGELRAALNRLRRVVSPAIGATSDGSVPSSDAWHPTDMR